MAGMQRSLILATIGLFDPPVRDLLGYTWLAATEKLHRLFGDVAYRITKLLPKRLLMHPEEALGVGPRAWTHTGDAPLVETPARNLPPVEYRDNPHYYSPKV